MKIKALELIAKFQIALDNSWGYIWGAAGILWTEAKQKQKVDYMVNKYGANWKTDGKGDNYYYAALYGSKWIGHYVADCSGLFVWAFKQLGGSIYHGSNTMYKTYCSAKGKLSKGKRSDGKEMLAGTAVFTGSEGSHGHVGLYIGNGKVIEAQGTKAGVILSDITLSKWTYWGELKDVEYGDSPAPAPSTDLPTLRRGDKGEYVTLLQSKLFARGYDLGSCGVDGDFGKATEAAVKEFQRDHGLNADGVVGKQTWTAIENTEPSKLYTVTILHLPLYKAEALVKAYDGGSYMTAED